MVSLEMILQIAGWLAGAITTFGVIYAFVTKVGNRVLSTALDKYLKPITDHQTELSKEVRALRVELQQNNLQTARVDLNQAMEHAPHEHKAILDLAWHYFIELGGDTYMTGLFKAWAKREGVDISHILQHVKHHD